MQNARLDLCLANLLERHKLVLLVSAGAVSVAELASRYAPRHSDGSDPIKGLLGLHLVGGVEINHFSEWKLGCCVGEPVVTHLEPS